MMPINFDILYKPNNDYSIIMKWLGRPDLTTEISNQDLDDLIDRAIYLRTQLS